MFLGHINNPSFVLFLSIIAIRSFTTIVILAIILDITPVIIPIISIYIIVLVRITSRKLLPEEPGEDHRVCHVCYMELVETEEQSRFAAVCSPHNIRHALHEQMLPLHLCSH